VQGTLWEGGTRAATFLHSPLAVGTGTRQGIFHIVDWLPSLASLAGLSSTRLAKLGLDGIDQSEFLMQAGSATRTEFVYNIKTSPFKAGYRLGDYKLLWGEHSKGRWYDWRTGRKFKLDWERIQTKLTADHNLVDLEEDDWDLEDEKSSPSLDPAADFLVLSREQPVQLYNIAEDPLETEDLAVRQPELVETLKQRLRQAAATMRPGNFELKSALGHPFFRGGNFMPGWCIPET